jgi:hypothetical protein
MAAVSKAKDESPATISKNSSRLSRATISRPFSRREAREAIPAEETTTTRAAATILKLGVASLPLYPAIRINLDAAAGQGATWAAVAIGFVIFGAICIEHGVHSLRERQIASGTLWGLLGVAFLALNVMNALGNAASHSDHSRDQNKAKMDIAATIFEQRSQWSQRRAEQAKVAGEATPESLEAEARALKATNSKLWSASFSCDPNWITKEATKAFCAEVAKLEEKKAAATKRDQIDAQLAKLDDKAEARGEAPSTVDSFADAMADGLAAFGYAVDEKGKIAIVRARDWGKALGVELLAGFGPTALMLLFLRAGIQTRRTGEEERPKLPSQASASYATRRKPEEKASLLTETETASPAASPLPDPMQSFVDRRLERADGATIAAGDLWRLWQQDCKSLGIEPGTQQAFGRMAKKWFKHDKNNGRPRYENVRPKHEHAVLRLAVNNS